MILLLPLSIHLPFCNKKHFEIQIRKYTNLIKNFLTEIRCKTFILAYLVPELPNLSLTYSGCNTLLYLCFLLHIANLFLFISYYNFLPKQIQLFTCQFLKKLLLEVSIKSSTFLQCNFQNEL